MKKLAIVVAFVVLSALQASPLYAGEKLGKLFIKASVATVDGQQFTDQSKEESVEDLKSRNSKFVIVDSEKEADYLIVVVERNRAGNKNELKATLSSKQNGQWKPGAGLTGIADTWRLAARKVMGQANDWVEAQGE